MLSPCIICGYEVADGISIQEQTVCVHCEQAIVKVDIDHPLYPIFVEKLKVLMM